MKQIVCLLSLTAGAALLSLSAQAACGGGGFKPVKVVKVEPVKQEAPQEKRNEGTAQANVVKAEPAKQAAPQENSTQATAPANPKLEKYQRDIDKAQEKLDHCSGDCTKERQKLEEAKAKYAKKASEL